MKEKIQNFLKNRNTLDFLLILFLAIILFIPTFSSKQNVYIDDGIQHIARAYGTHEAIKSDGIFARVIPSFTSGYGYSWDLFYGPLSTWGIILIELIFRNYIVAYKIFCFICMVLSGVCMYRLMLKMTRNQDATLLATAIYMTFPYHLNDFYLRNALGEYVAFIFIPLVFLGLYNLLNTSDNYYQLALGAIGLILTHNLTTLITAFFAFIYLLFHFKALKETRVKKGILISLVFILLVTMFFWAPMIETKFATNYHVYEKDAMSTPEDVQNHALGFSQLFVTRSNSQHVLEIGIHIIIMLCFTWMTIKLLKERIKKEYIFFLVGAIISIVLATKIFPWKYMPNTIRMIQFPWRMMGFFGFFVSVICAINMSVVLKKFSLKDVIVISLISLCYICAFYGYIHYDEIYNISDYYVGNVTGKDGEIIIGMGKAEYLPEKAFNNRFYIATKENNIYVLEGKAVIEEESKEGSKYYAKIKTIEEDSKFELPYVYYPGYEVRTDGIIKNYYETEHGLIGVDIEKNDEVTLEVDYVGTNIIKISAVISFISAIVFAGYIWKKS